MSKIITSPIPEFPGTVTLNDKPTMQMVERFMDAKFTFMHPVIKQRPVVEDGKFVYLDDGETMKTFPVEIWEDIPNMTPEQIRERREIRFASALPLILAWNIEGQPKAITGKADMNPFPYTPVSRLIQWIFAEIFVYCTAEREIPKALPLGSIDTQSTTATASPQS